MKTKLPKLDKLPTNVTIWLSPLDDKCEATGMPLNGVMYDAKVYGVWGNYCEEYFNSDHNARLGVGFGQKYVLYYIENEKCNYWIKVAG